MKIDTFVDIVDGVLLNTPSISAFDKIKLNSANINRGDLFVSYDTSQIEEAIQNGAYGILTDKKINITDKEIAWITVKDFQVALKRLIDIDFNQGQNSIVFVSHFAYDCFEQIIQDKKNIILLPSCIEQGLENLLEQNENTYFIAKDEQYELYFRDINHLEGIESTCYNITKSSLFNTSFVYNNKLFENIKLPSIFINDFCTTIEYCDTNNISYSLSGYSSSYFTPIFINDNFKPIEYGKSQKVIVSEKDATYMQEEINILLETKWAKNIILLSEEYDKTNTTKNKSIFIFKDNNQLIDFLQNKTYDIALIFSKNFEISTIEKTNTQNLLF